MPLDKFGSFESILTTRVTGVPLYLNFLGSYQPKREMTAALRALDRFIHEKSPSDEDVCNLLRDINWRPHLIAIGAILLRGQTPRTIGALWQAFDANSWVTPQIAAGLSLVDPNFVGEAKGRLSGGTAQEREQRQLLQRSRIEEYAREVHASGEHLLAALHSAQGPDGLDARNQKATQALVGLLGTMPDEVVGSREVLTAIKLQESSSSEDFSSFTVQWRDALQSAFAEVQRSHG